MNMANQAVVNHLSVETTLPIFWVDCLSLSDQLLKAREAIAELRQSHPQTTLSNVKSVYMSPWNSHKLNPKLIPICQSVMEYTQQAVLQYMNSDISSLNWTLNVTDCWGAIYEEEDYAIAHKHFPSDFSAVLYLEAEPGCAPIIFADKLKVNPRPNLLIIFPGLLMHHVPKNTGKRTVVVMNMHKFPKFASS